MITPTEIRNFLNLKNRQILLFDTDRTQNDNRLELRYKEKNFVGRLHICFLSESAAEIAYIGIIEKEFIDYFSINLINRLANKLDTEYAYDIAKELINYKNNRNDSKKLDELLCI